MRSSITLGAVLLGTALLASAQSRPQKLWLLEDTAKKQWCAYTDQKRWESERDATDWITAGTVDFTDGKVTRVFLTVPSDSGDWVVSDQYAINDTGLMETLTRYTDQFKGGFFERSIYFLEDKQAVLVSREFLTPDDVVLPADPDSKQTETGHSFRGHLLPDLKVWLHLIDFPFSAFLEKDHKEVWETGRTCTASEQ
jgi:hypothetical protein